MKQSERIMKYFDLRDCEDMLISDTNYTVRIVPEGQIEPLLKFLSLVLPDPHTHRANKGELFSAVVDPHNDSQDTTDALVFRRGAYSSDHESDNIDQQACLIDMQILRNNFDGEHDE